MSLTSAVTNISLFVERPDFSCCDSNAQVNIDDGFLNLMTQDGTTKDDVKVPEGDIGKQILEDFEGGKELLVTIISAMGEEAAITVRSTT